MAISLVQSKSGGSIASSGSGSGSTTFTTTSVGFDAPTTPGNLLVCIVNGNYQSTNGVIVAALGLHFPPTTPSFTWTSVRAPFGWSTGPSLKAGTFGVAYIENAPAMAPTDLTTVSSSTSGNPGGTYDVQLEFTLYEFSGIATSSSVEQNKVATGTSSIPNPGTIITTNDNDLLLVAYAGNRTGGVNVPPGAAYTLGINDVVATLGQAQYQLGGAAGAYPTAFAASVPNWGAMAVAFKAATIVAVPILQVAPLSLSYTAAQGGLNPADQTVAVANGNGGTLSWSVASDQSWLTRSPASGTDAGVVTASVNITGLTVGVYTGHLTFTASGATGSPQIVVVTLTITTPVTNLSVTPTSLSFDAIIDSGNPPAQFATVSNVGTLASMPFTVVSNHTWLLVAPLADDAGTAPVQLTVDADITGLIEGVYNGTLTVTTPGALNSPQIINVNLTVTTFIPPPPPPTILSSMALTQVDTWELDHGTPDWGADTGVPYAWHETTLPQQQLAISPTPGDIGALEVLYVALAEVLTGAGIALTVPDDWTPYILWGTLGELLSSDGPSFDPVRAQYCSRRMDEGVELARLVLGG